MSYADLQRMPDDGNRYELYDGELRVVPSPLPLHQLVVERLFLVLHEFRERDGGRTAFAPFDIVLSEYNVVQPDIMYFSALSARRIRLREHVRFGPDLAIEVISPSTASHDRGRKRALMERFQVPEYWIVDPYARRIEVSSLQDGHYGASRMVSAGTCRSSRFPGLEVSLEQLFQDLDD